MAPLSFPDRTICIDLEGNLAGVDHATAWECALAQIGGRITAIVDAGGRVQEISARVTLDQEIKAEIVAALAITPKMIAISTQISASPNPTAKETKDNYDTADTIR